MLGLFAVAGASRGKTNGVSRGEATSAPSPTPAPATQKPTPQPRFSLNLTPEGKVDVSAMHAKTRAQLTKIVLDDDLRRELGGESAPAAMAPAGPPPGMEDLLQLLAGQVALSVQLINGIIMRRQGIPEDIIRTTAPLTERQQDAIMLPLGRVLVKHLGKYLSAEWADEAALAAALVTIPMLKLAEARSKRDTRSAAEPPAPAEPPSRLALTLDPNVQ